MSGRFGPKFLMESTCAVIFLVLCALTLLSGDWIEAIFGVDPDAGSGALEWLLVGTFGVLSATSAMLARIQWRRVTAAGP